MSALAWHLLRGVAAAALLAAAFSLRVGQPYTTILLLPAAVLLLRFCPMCWLLGLAERLRDLSVQRG